MLPSSGALLLRTVWEEPGRRVHSQGQDSNSWPVTKDQSSLNGHIDREGAGQSSGSSDAEGKGRKRKKWKDFLKAFSFQPPLRILNAFYPTCLKSAFYCLFNLPSKLLGRVSSVVVMFVSITEDPDDTQSSRK